MFWAQSAARGYIRAGWWQQRGRDYNSLTLMTKTGDNDVTLVKRKWWQQRNSGDNNVTVVTTKWWQQRDSDDKKLMTAKWWQQRDSGDKKVMTKTWQWWQWWKESDNSNVTVVTRKWWQQRDSGDNKVATTTPYSSVTTMCQRWQRYGNVHNKKTMVTTIWHWWNSCHCGDEDVPHGGDNDMTVM